MKRILITAGSVYAKLDDNKIVSNRARGTWAVEFAKWLASWSSKVYAPILLVPDIAARETRSQLEQYAYRIDLCTHTGYDDYRRQCVQLAPVVDAAIMAAAVTNWIPERPFVGKMPTDTDRQLISFILAPRVINKMKALNPKLTLIGCKLLFNGDKAALVDAAYHVVLAAKCNAVVANDAKLGLRSKYVVHQDRAVSTFENDFKGLYEHLRLIIDDVHYQTVVDKAATPCFDAGIDMYEPIVRQHRLFDHLTNTYRSAFVSRQDGVDRVLGAVAVRLPNNIGYLVSPREKGQQFSAQNAVIVTKIKDQIVYTSDGKASLNAPLLIRHLDAHPNAQGVVHYHGDWDGWKQELGIPGLDDTVYPVVAYAPPGTARDNERTIPGSSYKIQGHGWIIAVDINGRPL